MANIGLLSGRRWGLFLAFLTVGLTAASIAFALFRLALEAYLPAPEPVASARNFGGVDHEPVQAGGLFLSPSATYQMARLALLATYAAALFQFPRFFKQIEVARSRKPPEAIAPDPAGFAPAPSSRPPPEPPTFAYVMVIADLICLVVSGTFSFFGALMIFVVAKSDSAISREVHRLGDFVYFDLAADVCMVLSGVAANIALLGNRPRGLRLGAVAVIFTLVSIAFGFFGTIISWEGIKEGIAEQGQEVVGFSIASMILRDFARLGLLAMYVVALVQFARYFKRVKLARSTKDPDKGDPTRGPRHGQ